MATAPPASPQSPDARTALPQRDTHAHPIFDDAFAPGSSSTRRFVRWFLIVLALSLAAIGAFNAYVDPFGTIGSRVYQPITSMWIDRDAKAQLIAELDTPPDVVLLGSSTMREASPAVTAELTGEPAFNASVSGGIPLEIATITNMIANTFPDASIHYVYGIDVEAAMKREANSAILSNPSLRSSIPMRTRVEMMWSEFRKLFELETLKLSKVALDRNNRFQEIVPSEYFTSDGFRTRDPYAGKASLHSKLDGMINRYESTIYEPGKFDRIDDSAIDAIAAMVKTANDHGDTPVIVLTPMHPKAASELGPQGRDSRRAELIRRLKDLQAEYRFELVDFGDPASYGGNPREFYDGVHQQPSNMRRMLEELADRGLLTSAGA